MSSKEVVRFKVCHTQSKFDCKFPTLARTKNEEKRWGNTLYIGD